MASSAIRSTQVRGASIFRWQLPAVKFLKLFCLTFMTVAAGCSQSGNHSNHLPAPLRDDFPYELNFCQSRVWEPESFEIDLDGVLHRIVLACVEPPPPDHPQHQIAIDKLRDFVGNAQARALVQGRDRYQREIAQVFVLPGADHNNPGHSGSKKQTGELLTEFDVGLRLIEFGLVRCGPNQIALNHDYQQAEAKARAEQRGLWKKVD